MSWLLRLRLWLRALLRRRRVEREMSAEMQFHLDMEIARHVAAGVPVAEARRRALVAFGGLERYKESVRDERGTRWIDDFVSDVRYALRGMARDRGFSVTVVATLAIGIGATVTVFTIANAVLFRPVPGVTTPNDELAIVEFEQAPGNATGISFPNFVDLRAATEVFAVLGGEAGLSIQLSSDGTTPVSLSGTAVAGEYFEALGVRAQRGRLFVPSELEGAPSRVAVISDRLWRTQFGSDSAIIGRRIRINAEELIVIGVAPRGFRGIMRSGGFDVWLPLPLYPIMRHSPERGIGDRAMNALNPLVGRLKDGATPAVAQNQLRAAMRHLVDAHPQVNKIYSAYLATVAPGIGTMPLSRDATARIIELLLGIVSLVLVIACANVANLLLVRGIRRRHELAIRRALGAPRGRVVRQYLAEGIVFGAMGATAGVAVAVLLERLFAGQGLWWMPAVEDVAIDLRVLAFIVMLSLATSIVFAAIPAVQSLRQQVLPHLGDSARAGAPSGARVRGTLTVTQIAASAALLIGAMLLARTVINLRAVPIGFEADGLMALSFMAQPQGYDERRLRALRRRILDELSARPDLEQVTLAYSAPFACCRAGTGLKLADAPADAPEIRVWMFGVGPKYHETLGIRLLGGRGFTAEEYNDPAADGIVVSRSVARQLVGDANPLGLRVKGRRGTTHTVIGVVEDTRGWDLRTGPEPLIYTPLASMPFFGTVTILVRSRRPASDVEATVRSVVAEIDRNLPFFRVATMTDNLRETIADERVFFRLVGALAALAALITGVGLYGLIAYSVAQRTREIGIRMALGARIAEVVSDVARQVGTLVIIGFAAGAALAPLLSRFLDSRLFGVSRLDPLTYGVVAVAVLVVGVVAGFIPARSAARVNPVDALRHE